MKNTLILFLSIIFLGCNSPQNETDFVQFVNPLIGTAPLNTISSMKHSINSENNSQVIPSVTAPFAMTNWTPQTQNVETKCVAPYYYIDTLISGFRGSHWLSGSCTQDYGSFTLMPLSNTKILNAEKRGSKFSHDNEISRPYYYKVHLDDYDIDAEMTATKRSGLLKFTFNNADSGVIVIEPNSDENEGYIKIIPEKNEIIGYNPAHRIYQGWGERTGFSGYFVAQFNRNFSSFGTYKGDDVLPGDIEITNQEKIGGFVTIKLKNSKTVIVKVGTSFTSIEAARKNLYHETVDLDFDAVLNNLKTEWNKILTKVEIDVAPQKEKIKFYTALYHSYQQPRLFNDVDGTYPSFDGNDSLCNSGNRDYYDDFSVWDTYRASHPLFNLLIPELSNSMVNSLLLKAEQGGWLPIFPCWNSYTSAMIGDHVISVIADAYIKGIIDLDETNYNYLKQNATKTPKNFDDYVNGKGRRALTSYLKYGYVPLEDKVNESTNHKGEQVSRTLEYSYDDYVLSQVSKKMGKMEDYNTFLARSKNYVNVYDPTVESVRGRFANGEFTDEFIKTERMEYITEGTPWQYTWYVPHDVEGLIELMGGEKEFNNNLDEFFENEQYWHGNEPGHQIPFLYTYSGQPWKTQEIVGKILKEEYAAVPGGLSGNDDAGQMSAWYVFSAMGFYPVAPGKDEYAIYAPSFEKYKINFPNGKNLVVKAVGLMSGKTKVKEIILNGEIIENNKIQHTKIVLGGTLEFIME